MFPAEHYKYENVNAHTPCTLGLISPVPSLSLRKLVPDVFGAHANVMSNEFDVVKEKFKCYIEESIPVMYCIIRFKKKSKWSLFSEVL